VDSTGQTIDFLLTATRDADGAKRFFRKVFVAQANPIPRVVNVDKNPVYPAAIDALKGEGTLPRRFVYASANISTTSSSRITER
jgi:transposase-like protein